jgi:periplasmic protein TonB
MMARSKIRPMRAPARPPLFANMEPQQRNLTIALVISLLLHAVVLSIHFKLPQALNKATEQALDVILVNTKSARKPEKAQAKAQANLEGGGNTDEDRRAKTPLPVAPKVREGSDLKEAQQRIAQLEAQQQQMLTQFKSQKTVPAEARRNEPTPVPPTQPSPSGLDLATAALNLARLEGQIARNLEEYNKRPRKKFVGARVEEYRFAQYVEDWRQKVERIGNLNYPSAAKGRLYGNLVLTAVIKSDGSLDRVEINRTSGQKVLDEAARRIVEMAAPYPPFPDAIRRDTDILEITRTWSFTTSDRLQSE